ncbi:hypothetical protein [Peptoniphilus timonensis]|uniref:hypothetical protein n=1 Tax=Peptoniphilus timonensis TaxID=1268254 RepID=UPI0002FEAC02|nr:hypothetical protein [Peptoniphilus timonensis]
MQTIILLILVILESLGAVYILEQEEVIHPIARVTDFFDRQKNGIKDDDISEVDNLQNQKFEEEEQKAKEEEDKKMHEKMDETKKKLDQEVETEFDDFEIDEDIFKDQKEYMNIK